MKRLNWTVFVSQTGTEVYDICNKLGILPRSFVTSNSTKLSPRVEDFLYNNGVEMYIIPRNPKLNNYMQEYILESQVISLHGFLRILPAEFIEAYKGTIYNGHPGLITKYPELKGKDPQVRAWEGNYPEIGSIVHEVIPEVDEGKVLYQTSIVNSATTLDEVYDSLRITSLKCWEVFLSNKFELNKETPIL